MHKCQHTFSGKIKELSYDSKHEFALLTAFRAFEKIFIDHKTVVMVHRYSRAHKESDVIFMSFWDTSLFILRIKMFYKGNSNSGHFVDYGLFDG